MKFDTFNVTTFRDNLFDTIEEYFEEIESKGKEIKNVQDFQFLKQISIQAANTIPVPELISYISAYVEKTGLENVSEIVQELYENIAIERARQQSSEIKEQLSLQVETLEDSAAIKDELLQLMMCDFSQSHDYHAYLVTADKLQNTASSPSTTSTQLLYQRIREILKNNPEEKRLQLIVRQVEHYTMVDIDTQLHSCFILDAAGDIRQFNLHELVHQISNIEKVYYARTETYILPEGDVKQARLQQDQCSCSVFAMDHSFEVAKDRNIHHWLQENATQDGENSARYYIDWVQLPANLIRNAQSPSFRKYYMSKNPESISQLNAYLEENTLKTAKDHFKTRALELIHDKDATDLERMIHLKDFVTQLPDNTDSTAAFRSIHHDSDSDSDSDNTQQNDPTVSYHK